MADSDNVNIDKMLTCSQPNLRSVADFETPSRPNKRSSPESPDELPATSKQENRQIRRRNSIDDISSLLPKKTQASRKSIADKVVEALTSPEVLNKIIPII